MSRRNLSGSARSIVAALALPLLAGLCACSDDRKPVPEEAPPAGTASPGLAAPGSPGTTGSGTPASAKGGAPAKGGVMLKVGDQAPDFKAQDHTGKERKLAEFRGKRIVLWFYPKAATGG